MASVQIQFVGVLADLAGSRITGIAFLQSLFVRTNVGTELAMLARIPQDLLKRSIKDDDAQTGQVMKTLQQLFQFFNI